MRPKHRRLSADTEDGLELDAAGDLGFGEVKEAKRLNAIHFADNCYCVGIEKTNR
jgi:hypothetical protein